MKKSKQTNSLRHVGLLGVAILLAGCGGKAVTTAVSQPVQSAPAGPGASVKVKVLNYTPRALLSLHANNDYGNIDSPLSEAVVSWETVTNPNNHEVTIYAQPDNAFVFTAAFRISVSTGTGTIGGSLGGALGWPIQDIVYGLYRPKWSLNKVIVRDEADQSTTVKLQHGVLTLTLKPKQTLTLGWVAGVAGNENICEAERTHVVQTQQTRRESVRIVGQTLGYLLQREYRQDDGQGERYIIFQSTTQSRVTEGVFGQGAADNLILLNGSWKQVESCDRIELK